MTTDAPVQEPAVDSAAAPPRTWPVIRTVLAGLLTVVLLPYAWGFTLITTMMTNFTQWPNAGYLAQVGAGVAAVILLNFHVADRFSRKASAWIVGLIAAGWLIVNATIVVLSTGPQTSVGLALAGYLPGTLWLLWLSWMFYARLRWTTRIGVLALSLVGVAAFVGMFRIRDLTGDNRVNFALVWDAPAARFEEWPQAPAPGEAVDTAEPGLIAGGPHDSPQYLGPERNAVLHGVRLKPDWSAQPPREVWRQPVGAGWSSFATFGNLAITQEQRGETESVVCYDIRDGAIVWTHGDPVIFDNTLGGPGPRATPTISEQRVFAVGATGVLNCLKLDDGEKVWSTNILEDNDPGGDNLSHGVCASPLIVNNLVVVCPPGKNGISLAAYDRDTGEQRWQAGRQRASYTSPLLAEFDGVPQILTMTGKGVVGHDASTGKVLWDFPLSNDSDVNCSQPIPHAAAAMQVFISTGYGAGSALVELQHSEGDWSADEVWTSRRMKTKFTTPVLLDGYVYGLDDGILQCIELESGKQKWKRGRYGHGQILLVEDLLVVQTEPGEVVLVRPDPSRLEELGSIEALSDKTWNPPVLAGKYLLVRNDREAICFEVALEETEEAGVALGPELETDAPQTGDPQ